MQLSVTESLEVLCYLLRTEGQKDVDVEQSGLENVFLIKGKCSVEGVWG